MKVVLEVDKGFPKREAWTSNGFELLKNIDGYIIEFYLYDGMEKKVAVFTLYFEPFNAVACFECMTLYDKSFDQRFLLEFFLDYLYTFENPYFKLLGLRLPVIGSGMSEFPIQCVGFFPKAQDSQFYFHLNPNFEEALTLGTQNEEVKSLFQNNYEKYVTWQNKHINRIKEKLSLSKIYLAELETEGKNKIMIESKRQEVESYEAILESLENRGLYR